MPLTAGARLGPYEVIDKLGEGGMGEVYRARDTKLDRDVALKTLPDSFASDADRLARFTREAKMLAALSHPHIAAIYGLETEPAPFLVMELVAGEDLSQRMARGAVPLDEALPIAKQIADALEAAHELGIVHRDLKPANIKIRQDGTVKVLDFGLAKVVEGGPASGSNLTQSPTITSPGLTLAGFVVGTPAYMSPEQARGKVVDKRCDIWSFGVVLYELLTGERLFNGTDGPEVLAQVLTKQPDLERVPSRVRRLLAKCLERDPTRRLRDIGDAWELLEDSHAAGAPPPPSTSRSRWGLAVVTAAIAMALTSAAFLYLRETPATEPTLRYTIAPPEGTNSIHSFAISPDGRTLAIAAAGNGKRQLWLRALDTLETRPMPSTEGATYPFWSPDGSRIGFFAQGTLKKVAASGGPAEALCPVPDGRGGSWSKDDVIVFSSAFGGNAVIQRVAASGGTPVEITDAKGSQRHPSFLPDGRRFLSMVSLRSEDTNGVYVTTLDSKESRRILPDVSAVVLAPPAGTNRTGHLFFVRNKELIAQPFDVESAQTSGDPVLVAQAVSLTTNDTYAPVTVSETGVLLYETAGPSADVRIGWYDRTGKLLDTFGTRGDVSPSLSPDGTSAAFARAGTLWMRDLARGTEQILTTDGLAHGTPHWSPAGDRLAYTTLRDGVYNIFLKAATGSAQGEPLVSSSNSKAITQWSRDGRFLVFQEFNPKTKRDIWVFPMDGGTNRQPTAFLQTASDEMFGQLSPDGHWMTYASDESGRREVYARPFPEAGRQWLISTAGGEQPLWRADGKELFFQASDGKMMAVPVNAVVGSTPSFTVGTPLALFDARMVLTENGAQFQYDVSADGQHFLIIARRGAPPAAEPLTVVVNWTQLLRP